MTSTMNPKIEALLHSLHHSDLYIGHWRISSSTHPEEPLEYRISKKGKVIFIDVGGSFTCLDGEEIRTFSTWSDQQLSDSGNADYQVKSLSGISLLFSPWFPGILLNEIDFLERHVDFVFTTMEYQAMRPVADGRRYIALFVNGEIQAVKYLLGDETIEAVSIYQRWSLRCTTE